MNFINPRLIIRSIVIFVFFSASCGDSIKPKSESEPVDISSICESRIERGTRCEEFVPELAACERDKLCEQKRFSPKAFIAVSDCEIELACGASDDFCNDSNALALTLSAPASAYLDDCMPRASECGLPGEELCNGALIFTDAILIELKACLALPCKKIPRCVRGPLDICD